MMTGSLSGQSLHLSISNDTQSMYSNTEKYKRKNNVKINNSTNKNLKPNDPLRNLMDQKQRIADSRQKYLDNALSKNESAQSIKEKLAEYDKQIAEIDKQINELKLEEQKKHLGAEDKANKNDKEKNNSNNTNSHGNSKKDTSSKMMSKLVSLSNNMSQAKVISSERASESGQIGVLKIEIKEDEIKNPIGASRKRKQVSKLEDNIEKMNKTIGDKLNTNISNNDTHDVINKNQQNENSEEEKLKNDLNVSGKNPKLLDTIQNYKNNIDDKSQANGQKLNSIV